MLMKIKVFIVLVSILFSVGCFNQRMNSISDCERIKEESKRDNCFVSLIEDISLNNTDLRIKICDEIIDLEIRDVCFFKVAQEGWRVMSVDTLINLCGNIISDPLRNSCIDLYGRPHLQRIK